MNLSKIQVHAIVSQNYQLYHQKFSDGIKFKMKKVLGEAQVQDIVSEALTNMLSRFESGLIQFDTERGVNGYILNSCWFNYRDSQVKGKGKPKATPVMDYDTLWLQEFPQQGKVKQCQTVYLEDLPDLQVAQQEEDYDTLNDTEVDVTLSQRELLERIFQHLEECILDRTFSFRDVNIYKQFIINGWTKAQMVRQSAFSRDVVDSAIKRIQAHIRGIDW